MYRVCKQPKKRFLKFNLFWFNGLLDEEFVYDSRNSWNFPMFKEIHLWNRFEKVSYEICCISFCWHVIWRKFTQDIVFQIALIFQQKSVESDFIFLRQISDSTFREFSKKKFFEWKNAQFDFLKSDIFSMFRQFQGAQDCVEIHACQKSIRLDILLKH